LKLEVLNSTKDTVEFKAFFMENGSVNTIHENLKFCKENGRWLYFSFYKKTDNRWFYKGYNKLDFI